MISGAARLAGVIGWPIAHSLSPRLHSYWLAAHGIDGAYVPFAVRKEDFSRVVSALRLAAFKGLNVTLPHKQAAFAIATRADEAAHATGAANLLLFEDGAIEARNTDVPGLAASLTQGMGRNALAEKSVAILGAGGAARAAVLASARLGAGDIRIVAREPRQGHAIAQMFDEKIAAKVAAFSWADWPRAAKNIALLVNATSGGMAGAQKLDIGFEHLPLNAVICDLVYNPLETELLHAARALGHRTIDGLDMLMHQAVPAFEAFYGEAPAVTPALRNELKKALRHG